ncbi:unnamed protein product [Didymodactylos carnosus]|uniref:Uncharacterized protein n=1 Tax=Didymodactylos carnosus TaxID=1234261 RepID=A0A813ZUS1_9BILA|nr:unnamed protein product [Didymodactylos carnosus]CAF1073225.1 unnamed protein product [Didymodactylos carnosus]CAF3685696.1 unnamed protein product [Didymodactylos carnosus]CAF3837247.1 unnamed protein product [Didymodactylos carnosus]
MTVFDKKILRPTKPTSFRVMNTMDSSVPLDPTQSNAYPSTFSTLPYITDTLLVTPASRTPFIDKQSSSSTPIIKDLRTVNIEIERLESFVHENEDESTCYIGLDDENEQQQSQQETHVQETVEVIPIPLTCERIFYSYVDDTTEKRLRTYMKLNQGVYIKLNDYGQLTVNDQTMRLFHGLHYDHRFKFDFYSTTLYIFPKQRKERFISEIKYYPEHITLRYKTKLEILEKQQQQHQHQQKFRRQKQIYYRI